jgi:nickel-dependent lactate racemase
MSPVLRYGAEASLDFDFSEGELLAECGVPAGPICDPRAATSRALTEPLSYPPLAQSVLSSDQVVVALENGVPQAAAVVAAVVNALIQAGVSPDGITVLRTGDDAQAGVGDPSPLLPDEVSQGIKLLAHDPTARQSLAYLAATERGDPVLLNRALTDADVVLPVGSVPGRLAGRYRGVPSLVYPSFSDQSTQLRFRGIESRASQGEQRKQLAQEVRQVAWLLGVTFAVQVVPGPGDRLLHVLAGEIAAVRRQGRQLYEAAWQCSVPHRARLVVAAIEGGSTQQTWHNVGRAVAAAEALVEDGGAIAVCSELQTEPGPALQCLAEAATRQEALRQIRRQRLIDALPAAQLAQATEHVKLYLLSRLDPALLEDLEIAPVSDGEDVVRLAQHYESCILLGNASRVMVPKGTDE